MKIRDLANDDKYRSELALTYEGVTELERLLRGGVTLIAVLAFAILSIAGLYLIGVAVAAGVWMLVFTAMKLILGAKLDFFGAHPSLYMSREDRYNDKADELRELLRHRRQLESQPGKEAEHDRSELDNAIALLRAWPEIKRGLDNDRYTIATRSERQATVKAALRKLKNDEETYRMLVKAVRKDGQLP